MFKRTYYCDCKVKKGKISRGNIKETEVYEDLTCKTCGYYAKIKVERVIIEPDGVRLETIDDQSGKG